MGLHKPTNGGNDGDCDGDGDGDGDDGDGDGDDDDDDGDGDGDGDGDEEGDVVAGWAHRTAIFEPRISALHHALQAAPPGLTAPTLQALDGSLETHHGDPVPRYLLVSTKTGHVFVFLTIHVEGQHFGPWLSIKQDQEGSRRIKSKLSVWK